MFYQVALLLKLEAALCTLESADIIVHRSHVSVKFGLVSEESTTWFAFVAISKVNGPLVLISMSRLIEPSFTVSAGEPFGLLRACDFARFAFLAFTHGG
mmetsp:Transcript_12331/g.50710  ORF Transcript_12331/g.50710 Transcript_12331/m.50710 type:complete len:99 (-) Transcript_12331:116-412(-)